MVDGDLLLDLLLRLLCARLLRELLMLLFLERWWEAVVTPLCRMQVKRHWDGVLSLSLYLYLLMIAPPHVILLICAQNMQMCCSGMHLYVQYIHLCVCPCLLLSERREEKEEDEEVEKSRRCGSYGVVSMVA